LERLVVREYLEGDEAGVLECIAELQEVEREIDPRLRPGASMASEHFASIRERCVVYHGSILVAVSNGVISGFVSILTRVPFESLDEPPGTHALLADLVVRDRFQRRGIGAELLEAAERFARSAGAVELRVGVLSRNRPANLLYRTAGFAAHEETLVKRLDLPPREALPAEFAEPAQTGAEPASLRANLMSYLFRSRRRAESYYEPRRHDFTTACVVLTGVAGAFYAGATRWELMSDANAGFATGFAKYQLAVGFGAILFAIGGGLFGFVVGHVWERWHRRRRTLNANTGQGTS
jgi:GNAT superfamily N-acetyltransferase